MAKFLGLSGYCPSLPLTATQIVLRGQLKGPYIGIATAYKIAIFHAAVFKDL